MLEKMKTHTYIIEFQKRYFFHTHISIIAHFDNNLSQININNIVHLIISNFDKDLRLYELITKYKIHKTCHDKKKHCTKLFLKMQLNVNNLNHFFYYSQYRSFEQERMLEIIWHNIWVVSYNVYLLKKYKTYLNIKVYRFAKLFEYLYKYIFKK